MIIRCGPAHQVSLLLEQQTVHIFRCKQGVFITVQPRDGEAGYAQPLLLFTPRRLVWTASPVRSLSFSM